MNTSTRFSFTDHPHRRYNPLTKSWVLCSPHRAKRPWLGQTEDASDSKNNQNKNHYDPACHLCPGNRRASGKTNPEYKATFVFPNDFAAVNQNQQPNQITPQSLSQILRCQAKQIDSSGGEAEEDGGLKGIFDAESATGECRVICYSPRHDLTMAGLGQTEIRAIIQTWISIYKELSAKEEDGNGNLKYIQIFENKGAMMGCSNPHPHGQVWALSYVPEEPAKEIEALAEYSARNTSDNGDGRKACLLCKYAEAEINNHHLSSDVSQNPQKGDDGRSRVVCWNDTFVAVVPFWAVWPFETMVIARPHISNICQLDSQCEGNQQQQQQQQ
ncbi:galactose-1-phosphate uridyl transferase [Mycoemilia scoparia]|uniref:Galactose-1-phosphate uridylyltransferase n=1 Tax=Mycoemilia scoparia TaxID=417184 RepID=A0A9W7ZKK0_9FUNG|nr:galactose-1-phosphate uridyl transferase [Mycoemilia scoparia]